MRKKGLTTTIVIIFSFAFIIGIQTLILNEFEFRSGMSFTDEDVIITINGTIAEFYARYTLQNYSNQSTYSIQLPFALKPWNITLKLDGEPLTYFWTKSQIYPEPEIFDTIVFEVTILEGQKSNIEVTYFRNYEIIHDDSTELGLFRYIVGSTRSWGEPLDFAHFELWQYINSTKTHLETRHYINWLPQETFLYFYFEL
ncbi:MAG: hypothetical protein ACTSSH_03215 [Candidatus Heimdallarchaeota archaeon]